jgi:hypothetical protein
MGNMGGEKMSRLSVGLFALALVGGLAAFFGGLLDPYFVDEQLPANPAADMPFAKPKPAPLPPAASAPVSVIRPAATPAAAPEIAATTPAAPSAQIQSAVANPAPVEQPLVSTLDERVPADMPEAAPAITPTIQKRIQPTRRRDLDMRSCLDLPTEMEIAQCAYK